MQMYELTAPLVDGCRPVSVSGVRAGRAFDATDWVADEVPVALEYNGVSHAVMLATPTDLEDFAFGFSVTEGIVEDRAQIRDIAIEYGVQGITLQVRIAASCFAELKGRRRSMAGRTGCGLCGTDSLAHAVRSTSRVVSDMRFDASSVARAMGQVRDKQALLGVTGATHAAAWCNASGELLLLREDVGRHNALDKVIGALQRSRWQSGSGFMVITSRASYEMVHKTAAAGVALLAAVSGVTALAVDTAERAAVALIGFARGSDMSVYSHQHRISLDR